MANVLQATMSLSLLLLILHCVTAIDGAIDGKIDEGLGAQFVFGDSHVDAGNNNYLASLSRADFPPNGIDFMASGGKPTGRFTNGRTIADIVGEELGQPNYAPPFLDPNTAGRAILYGVNYASGAGGIMNHSGFLYLSRLGMDIQVDYFNITRQQLDGLLGRSQAKEFLKKKAIFSIIVGANDFLNNYLIPINSDTERFFETPDGFIDHLIQLFRGQLMRLYSLDARKFMVGNIVPIGCIPYQKTTNIISATDCVSIPNLLAERYNNRLKDLLIELNGSLPGANFVLANLYDIVMEIVTNYQKYGFETSSVACCGNGGQDGGIIPCGPASSMCKERSKYVFWDPYHPSETTNLMVAKYLVDGETNYVSPMNLRKLKDC